MDSSHPAPRGRSGQGVLGLGLGVARAGFGVRGLIPGIGNLIRPCRPFVSGGFEHAAYFALMHVMEQICVDNSMVPRSVFDPQLGLNG